MKLNNIFSDNMILQANKPVNVFGTGKGKVVVKIADYEATTISTEENWELSLPSFDYGGPYNLIVNLGGYIQKINNIYFGDVFLLSGQSNNQLKLWQTNTPKEYYKNNDSVRLFTVDRLEDQGKHTLTEEGWISVGKDGSLKNLEGEHYESKDGWIFAQKEELDFWPALGYLIGNALHKNSGHKIGLIACYQGASVIQSWIPNHILEETPYFVPIENRSENRRNPAYSLWNKDGTLYEDMLKKIIPFSLKSVIWYQGEGNTNGADSSKVIYGGILKILIEEWRKDFIDDSLPFIIVQIHDLMEKITSENCGWRNVQAAQENVCNTLKNAFLVKSSDICETNTIHPASKLLLALRIVEVLENLS